MNTFWGCETEALTELSGVFGTQSVRLGDLVDEAAGAVHAAEWIGPDAEDHRRRTDELVETVIELIERLRRLGELLGDEAEEQEVCSRPERTPAPAGGPPGIDPSDVGTWGPWIGGPSTAPDPLRPVPAPAPAGEEFALDPALLAEARAQRELALGAVPVLGTLQTLAGAHESLGHVLDRAEEALEGSPLEALTPMIDLARVPHAAAGTAVGEGSTFGQMTAGVDDALANHVQTAEEVSAAVGDGDWAGALRAGERGMYRHAGAVADILTATPVPAVATFASALLGTGADAIEVLDPEAAAPLREAERVLGESGRIWVDGRDRVTDAETYFELRRTHAPAPWDTR